MIKIPSSEMEMTIIKIVNDYEDLNNFKRNISYIIIIYLTKNLFTFTLIWYLILMNI
jgi:hypothetical protein